MISFWKYFFKILIPGFLLVCSYESNEDELNDQSIDGDDSRSLDDYDSYPPVNGNQFGKLRTARSTDFLNNNSSLSSRYLKF